jgi:hypothetical protein
LPQGRPSRSATRCLGSWWAIPVSGKDHGHVSGLSSDDEGCIDRGQTTMFLFQDHIFAFWGAVIGVVGAIIRAGALASCYRAEWTGIEALLSSELYFQLVVILG